MSGLSEEARIAVLEAEIAEAGEEVMAFYAHLLSLGRTPLFAHMLAMRQGPVMKNSDKAFGQGARRRMMGMYPATLEKMRAIAGRAGINTEGKYYVGGLGRYSDPHAWVSTAQDVKDVCKKKNLNATGVMNHKAIQKDGPVKRKRLAEDVIQDFERKYLQDPKEREKVTTGTAESRKKARQALRDKIVQKHAPPKRD